MLRRSATITHHVSLPCLFNVVCGDDDGCLLRGHQLQKVVPYPASTSGSGVG